jgi:hypothetical protein
MNGRLLTAVEIDRLQHVARALRRAPNPDERTRCTGNLVDVVNQLYVDGVRLVAIQPHLGMSAGRLRRLRRTRAALAVTPAAAPPTRITLDALRPEQRAISTVEQQSIAFDSHEAMATTSIGEAIGTTYFRGDVGNGVVIALGVQMPDRNGDASGRLNLNQEAKTAQRAMRGRREPVLRPDATLVDLQDAALRRPFILHVAAHREFGATMLAGHDGQATRVLDEDLVAAIAPTAGAPSAIMLSFCDSHEVAALIEDRDIAVISFHGKILDEAARDFYGHLYEALARGRSISLAFEVASGATRGSYGLTAVINPYSSAHARSLPL